MAGRRSREGDAGRRVSMADVAARAGVSQQTVSRVVNNAENVRPETRDRVIAAMDELGFRPNFAGRSLRGGHYGAVGLCMFDITRAGNVATLNGILEAARERNYAVTLFEVGTEDGGFSLERASRRMAELPIDGLIINMNRVADDFEEFTPLPSLRTVILTMYAHPRVTTIDSDQYGCSVTVINYLIKHGHTEIRYIAGPDESPAARFRTAGCHDALTQHGIAMKEPYRGDWSAESGYVAGMHIAQEPGVTAVYAANDQMAYGAMLALRDAGKRIPEDVSVVGVDDALEGVVPYNMLTSVRFDLHRRGRAVFACAVGDDGGHMGCYTAIRLPGELVERGSVASRA